MVCLNYPNGITSETLLHLVEDVDDSGPIPIPNSEFITLSIYSLFIEGSCDKVKDGLKPKDIKFYGRLLSLASFLNDKPFLHYMITEFQNRFIVGKSPREIYQSFN